MNKTDKNNRKRRDRFSVTIIGIVIYSIILIFVMAGTYIGTKAIIKNYEKKKEAVKQESEEAPIKEVIEEPEIEEEEEPLLSEDVLNEHAIDLSLVCDNKSRYIDYSEELFTPSKRDKTLIWQDSVFSRIENTEHPQESLVNTFEYKKVYGYLLDGSKIEFGVYINPETDLIEKIRSVSYMGDRVEVISYYYNKGNINYISHYNRGIDVPINIASTEVESRYYFANDEMVKYVYCAGDIATEYVVTDIDTYSEGTVEQFNYMEKHMLNYAYINYNIAKGLQETEVVTGYVLDEFNQPLSNASVSLYRDSDGSLVTETQSSEDGYYDMEINVDDSSEFTLKVSDHSLREENVYHIKAVPGCDKYCVEPIYMSYENNIEEYNLQILVRDATDMNKALAFAEIKFRNGINNTLGEVIASGTLNEAGAIIVPMLAGCYTAEVSLGGYENAFFNVIVKQDKQAFLGYAIPDLPENTMATVLTWDSTPLDLDARVFSSNAFRVTRSAVDSIGSTTPEVIYIENMENDEYEYFVSDYTACTVGDPLSYGLSSSNAEITIYNVDGLVEILHVPLAHSGVIWNAFKIRDQKVIPKNSYYYNMEDNTYWTTK